MSIDRPLVQPSASADDAVRERLLEERSLLRATLADSVADAAPVRSDVPDGSGETEHLVVAEQLVVAARLDTLTRASLDEVEAALARLDADQYGICVGCDMAVPAERLDAMPATAYCLACQVAHERYGR
jgi:DnaK suppressor protein